MDHYTSHMRAEEEADVLAWGLLGKSAHELSRREWERLRTWRDEHLGWQPGQPIDTADGAA